MKSVLKNYFLFLVLVAVLFNACSSEQSSLTGTYVNHAQSAFSIADDTLIVAYDKDQNYLIHRKTGFQLIDDSGKKGKLILESEELKAVYDEGSKSMTESKKGRVISFDLGNGVLMLEQAKYQRIN